MPFSIGRVPNFILDSFIDLAIEKIIFYQLSKKPSGIGGV